jgi:phosphonate transport system substrate-binding protein
MNRAVRTVLGVAALAAAVAVAAQAQETRPLQFGVLPNLSARVILQHYQPMRQYLEGRLKRSVEIVTAPDFKAFHDRTLKGDYDIAVTGPHLARLAQIDANLVPILTYRPPLAALMVTPAAKPFRAPVDLRGHTLAFANPQSLPALRGLQWLADAGLRQGTDYTVVKAANEDSLGQMLVTGGAAAAILSGAEFRAIPEEHRSKLVVYTTIAEFPSLTFAVHSRIPPADVAALKSHLLAFPDSPEGKQFLTATGFQGIRELGPTELRTEMDPYLPDVRRSMGGGR